MGITANDVWQWVCNVSPWKENNVDKIAIVEEQIQALDVRRTGIYESIKEIEGIEANYLQDGKDAMTEGKTLVAKRLASQLGNIRRDLARQNTVAAMHSKRIRILATDAHNMKLKQEAKWLELPTDDTLAANFAEAEAQVENVDLLADMASEMEAGIGMSDDEMDIMKEFAEPQTETVETVPVETVPVETDEVTEPVVAATSLAGYANPAEVSG